MVLADGHDAGHEARDALRRLANPRPPMRWYAYLNIFTLINAAVNRSASKDTGTEWLQAKRACTAFAEALATAGELLDDEELDRVTRLAPDWAGRLSLEVEAELVREAEAVGAEVSAALDAVNRLRSLAMMGRPLPLREPGHPGADQP